MTGKGYFYFPNGKTVFSSRFVFLLMAVLNPAGHVQYIELQADSPLYPRNTDTCSVHMHAHTLNPPPADQRPGSFGDSRDKDGVDEAGGTEAGGGCLPGPK